MAAWRPAKSLDVLLKQVNERWTVRDKSSDGTIGDAAHSARESDHNPNDAGVVCARDITNDPAHGLVSRALAEALIASRDERIKYIISNAQICSGTGQDHPAWVWRTYSGANDHRKHVHISVKGDPSHYDDTSPWRIGGGVPVTVAGSKRFLGITATVFGGSSDPNTSAYDNHKITDTELGVALPFHFSEPPRVRVFANGKSVECSVVDVGPWNTKDAYWQTGSRPQSESGTDSTGRKTNHAGIDLTPAAAHAIGIEGKGVVDWEFTTNTEDTPMADQTAIQDPIPEIIALLESARKYLPMISGFLPGGVGPIANAAIPIIEELLQLFEDAKTKSGTDLFHSVGARIETIGKGVQTAAHTAANPPAPSEGMPNS